MAVTANRTPDPTHLNHSIKERHHYEPCVIVIFGGAGDLSHRKLIPALYNLSLDGELPEKFAILGFSLEDLDDDKYRAFARSGIEQFSRRPITEEHWAKFAPVLHFQHGTFTEDGDYANLRKRLEELDGEYGTEGNRVYYFAIPPAFIDTCSEGLTKAGLIHPHQTGRPFYSRRRGKTNRPRSRECVGDQRAARAAFR
jgi:glucose-6-phosphate 1-dehydrogenase